MSRRKQVTIAVAAVATLLTFYFVTGGDESPAVKGVVQQLESPMQSPSPSSEATELDSLRDEHSAAIPTGSNGQLRTSDDAVDLLRTINPLVMTPLAIRQTELGVIPQAPNFTCPRFRMPSAKSADGKSAHEHIAKYTRYVAQYCNNSGFLQMNVPLRTFIFILDNIAKFVALKPGYHLLDWGSGCGTMLNYFHLKFNTSGIGIDLTYDAVVHAKQHHQPNQLFCHMDGSNLRAFESSSFDAIVSWATLYHVRRTLVQCDIVHQMVRLLKPGGRAYIGHLRTEKTQEYWKKGRCRPPGAVITRSRDYRTYHQPSWKRHQFFSLLVTKTNGTDEAAAQHVDD